MRGSAHKSTGRALDRGRCPSSANRRRLPGRWLHRPSRAPSLTGTAGGPCEAWWAGMRDDDPRSKRIASVNAVGSGEVGGATNHDPKRGAHEPALVLVQRHVGDARPCLPLHPHHRAGRLLLQRGEAGHGVGGLLDQMVRVPPPQYAAARRRLGDASRRAHLGHGRHHSRHARRDHARPLRPLPQPHPLLRHDLRAAGHAGGDHRPVAASPFRCDRLRPRLLDPGPRPYHLLDVASSPSSSSRAW